MLKRDVKLQPTKKPKCNDALRLGVNAGVVHSTCGITYGWQVKLCDLSLTCAIPERFRDEFLVIKHYTNLRLRYFTLLAQLQFELVVLQCSFIGTEWIAM